MNENEEFAKDNRTFSDISKQFVKTRYKLVYLKNEQALTDSLTVAEMFGKEHARNGQ